MGITNRTLVREGLSIRRSNTKEQAKMFFKVLTSVSLISLSALAAPQYAAQTGSVQCKTEYATLWDTEYKETETEECITEYEKVCRAETQRLCQPTTRQECNTVYEKQCSTVYKNVCVEQYKTEYEPYTETECVTEYKEDCEYQWEGHGHDKVWAPLAGTCKKNPYETCVDVAKTKEKQVAYPVCNDVPEQKCVSVPRQECVTVSDQVCTNQPLQKCQDVPRQACHSVHKKVPVRVSRQVPKKVCQDGQVLPVNIVPSPVNSGPEIVDVRKDSKNKETTLLFDRIEESPSDNAIVFGD